MGVPYPEPQMDWAALRGDKIKCEHSCAQFNFFHGGCDLDLLPSPDCGEYTIRPESKPITIDSEVLEALQHEHDDKRRYRNVRKLA